MNELEVLKKLITMKKDETFIKNFKKQFGVNLREQPEIVIGYNEEKDFFEMHFIFQNSYDGSDVMYGDNVEKIRDFLEGR